MNYDPNDIRNQGPVPMQAPNPMAAPLPPPPGVIVQPAPVQRFEPTTLGVMERIMGQGAGGGGGGGTAPPSHQPNPAGQAVKAGIIGKLMGLVGL